LQRQYPGISAQVLPLNSYAVGRNEMSEVRKVKCAVHGLQDEAFVCTHIVQSLHTGTPVGFHWPADSDQIHPDAWCSHCEDARIVAGGDWTPEVNEQLDIQLLCGSCYEFAKSIWARGKKVVQ
jgi:hypothetical protein